MKKENVLFSVIGLLLGFIIGFMFANSVNQRGAQPSGALMSQQRRALPPDHLQISSGADVNQPGQATPEVQAAIKAAQEQPGSFDAQMNAAAAYQQVQRYREAIEFLKRANQLRPNAYEPIVNLGNAHFDSNLYEDAQRWYTEALKINPDDVNVRTDLGLTFFFRNPPDVDRAIKEYRASLERDPVHVQTLQNLIVALIKKGDVEESQAVLAKLQEVNPDNPTIPRLRSDLEALHSRAK